MSSGAKPTLALIGHRDDETLVKDCLLGSETAWSDLINKYKNLIYSIPIKFGLTPEDAADIFQLVVVGLLNDLPQLREPKALPAWLIRSTGRKCIRRKRELQVRIELDVDETVLTEPSELPSETIEQVEREQLFREIISQATPDCRKLIELLFFNDPPLSYDEAARTLGIAKGSIGATRMRCLGKLRRAFERKGFH